MSICNVNMLCHSVIFPGIMHNETCCIHGESDIVLSALYFT